MSDNIQEFNKLIKQSELTEEERDAMIQYFSEADENDIKTLVEMFAQNPDMIVNFWRTLYAKLIFLELLSETDTLSNEAKEDITKKITQMSEEEFFTFLETLDSIKDPNDTGKIMQNITDAYRKIHDEIMNLTNNLSGENA